MVVVITALIFDFTNGFHDSSNAMATSVATGAFTPKRAVTVAAVLNIIGAFISTEVAKTISHGMFDDRLIQAAPAMVFAGLAGRYSVEPSYLAIWATLFIFTCLVWWVDRRSDCRCRHPRR